MSVLATYRREVIVIALAAVALFGSIWWASPPPPQGLEHVSCPVHEPGTSPIPQAPAGCK